MGLFKKLRKFVNKPITDANRVAHSITGINLPDPNNPMAALSGLMGGQKAAAPAPGVMDDPMSQTHQAGAHEQFNAYYGSTLAALANSATQPTSYQASPSWSAQGAFNPMSQMQNLMQPQAAGQRVGYGYYARQQRFAL